jgi:hypothetical protein
LAAQGNERRGTEVQWKIGLEGLSLAVCSPHQRPSGREPAGATGRRALRRTWMLAHVRTNLSVRSRATRDAREDAEDAAGGTGFRLALAGLELTAHPGSVNCVQLLWRHYMHAYARYQDQRAQLPSADLDRSIQRMLRSGRDAARGQIKKQAPALMSNLGVELRVEDARAVLLYARNVSDKFAFDVAVGDRPALVFAAIDLRNVGTLGSIFGDPRLAQLPGDQRALVASLRLIALSARSSVPEQGTTMVGPAPQPPAFRRGRAASRRGSRAVYARAARLAGQVEARLPRAGSGFRRGAGAAGARAARAAPREVRDGVWLAARGHLPDARRDSRGGAGGARDGAAVL